MLPENLAAQAALEPGEASLAILVSLLVLGALLSCYFLVLALHRRWIRKRYGFDDPVDLHPHGMDEPDERGGADGELPRPGRATT
ncbi:MAG TPA: hypothetical protein PK668_05615 [Myxococcota bacterium]|nr:hypothetical protein [Myxococcota bacterium]HRY92682.1 hypothetical protein [Myxococcota bacterium]HSA24115.1 hypothetical protein [Myxococcota bacterium]